MMMDFDAQDGNEFEDANLIQASGNAAPPAAARAGGTQVILTPNAQGVVVLPDGVSLEDVQVEGRNLVVIADDGTRYVIIDGAIFVPQLVIDGVVVPPVNLAALLVGNEPQPAAGPQGPGGGAQSSGGNFAGNVGDIQAAFDLGNLLPYTELQFPQDEEREIIPDIVDRDPDISIEIDDSGVSVINAQDAVNEAGLPARGSEPAGSNSAASSESTYGFINFSSPDGTSEVTLNGVVITQVGQTFTTPLGVLTIDSIADGRIGYSYVLTDNTTNPASMDNFAVTITDSDGDMATATLRIDIVDDVPTARNDTDSVPASTFTGQTGNVVTGAGTTSGAAGADTPGADGAALTGILAGTTGAFAAPGTVNGQYGTLSIDAQGNYTYTRSSNTPGGVNDVFTYQLTDGDGDTSTATLTISIGDAPATVIDFTGGTAVDEEGLPPRGSETPGSNEPADVETTDGTITFSAPDGVASVTINGTVVTGPGQQIVTPQGTLTIVSYDPVGGTIDYSFTLGDNTSGDTTQVELTVTVTDVDGDSDSGSFTIDIIDDTPTARADADSVTEDGPLVADGNVISGSGGTDANATDGVADTQGADGASVTAVAFGATDGTVGTALAGAYGSLTLNADGSYSYTLNNAHPLVQGLDGNDTLTEVFSYTLTDGDGDASTTTLTVTINGSDDVVVINGLDGAGAEEVVDEDDLSDGSSPDAAALTQGGTFTVDSPDGLATLTVNGTAVFGAGVVYPVTFSTAYGTMSVTGVATTTDANGDVTAATVSYSYTLTDDTAHTGANAVSLTESFAVAVTDTDGSTDTASLDVTIIDDVPTAAPDVDSVTEDGPTVADGNVITGSGGADANATDGAADTQGADGASVSAVAFGATNGTVGAPLAGAYGSLTLNADGSYTYTLDSARVQGLDGNDTLTEVFSYTLTDGDGDASMTMLTVTINGADDVVVINGLDGAGAEEVVDEDDLTDGSSPDAAALTQGGTFTVDSPDGLATLTVNGTAVFGAGVTYPVTFSTAYGTMSITGVATTTDGNGDVTSATVSYSYTLDDNTLLHTGGNDGSLTESFSVVATDTDGSSDTASLDVTVVDDVPTAHPNTNTVDEGATVGGNVLTDATDDVLGADGAAVGGAVTGVVAGSDTSNPVSGNVGATIAGTYGVLTLNADGSYTYDGTPNTVPPAGATDVFVYTITDGDGDTSTTTLTITLNDASFPVSDTDALVNEAGLPTGSDAASNSEVFNGAITPAGGTGPYTYTLTTSANGAYGNLVLNPDGTYSYTLDTAYDGATADNSTNTEQDRDSFSYTVTDANGNTATGTILVDIVDDVPTAFANTNSVAEGAVVGGNVLTDDTDDVFGADGPAGAGVTGVAAGTNTASPVSGGLGAPIVGTYGTLTLNANGTYSYDANPDVVVVGSVVDHFVYTITDGDGDTSTTTLDITINNVTVTAADTDALVNEAGLPTGSDAASNSEVFNGAITPAGGTGPYTYTLTTSANGAYGNLVLNPDGTYSYTLDTAYDGATADNSTNTEQDRDSFSYTVTDANGNTATGTILVDIVDDVPTARADTDSVTEGASTTGNVLDGTGTTNVGDSGDDTAGADGPVGGVVTGVATGSNTASPVSGNVGSSIAGAYGTLTFNANGSYTYDANPDAITGDAVDHFVYTITDGDGDTSTTTLDITVTNVTVTAADTDALVNEAGLATGSNPGSNSEIDSDGVITPSGGTGPYTYTLTTSANGTYGNLVLNPDGTYTYTLDTAYDGATANNGTNTEQDRDSFSYTVTDANGNTTTGTILVDIVDDVPTASITESGQGVSIDESAGVQGDSNDIAGPLTVFDTVSNKGVDPDMTAQFATNATSVVSSTGTVFGADGGAVAFSLTTSDPLNLGVDSGLNTTDGTNIFLFVEGGLVVGRVGATAGAAASGPAAFAMSIDSTGHVSMVEYLSIEHTNTGSKDESLSIADGALLAVVTVTDGDGDVSSASTAIGNLIGFQDDGPVITSAQNMNIQNSGDVAHTAAFAFDVGSDGPQPTNNEVKSVTFSAVVNGVTVQTTTPLTQVSEDATTAVFSFSFSYSNGTGTVNETGTITFNKAAGTYTVDLADPIAGISVQSVQAGQDPLFYDYPLPPPGPNGDVDNGIAVVELASDFFIQFTGQEDVTTPGSDFGHNDVWGGGDQAEVKISESDIGVFGNSVQDSDVLDYNFYSSNPGATLGPPTTSAGTAFITVAQFNASEDFVIVLKLADPATPGTYITRTIVVEAGDVLTTAPTGYPALGTNQGYIIIEPADYINLPGVPDNYQLVGLQLRSSNEGVSSTVGETYNYNGALGTSAFDTSTHAFDTANNTGTNDNDVFKIFDIGVVRTATTNQTATLTFDVTIQDGDGDELSQTLTATVTQNPDSTTNIALPGSSTTVVPVVLDLDGDGAEFVGQSAGVTFDYDSDGVAESTAWAGADDGILAIDLDADGQITSGNEIVFGGNGLTDLEGLAAKYDSNADGTLDGQDSAFAQFGVLHGGQFVSLTEAGIASIGLSSDGVAYTAANGEVIVHGTGTYTRTDGSTGTLADAAFATDRRAAEVAVATAAAGALVVPELLAANDTGTTTDEPQTGEAFAPISTEAEAAPSTSADQPAPEKLSYLLDDSAPVDEGAEQSSSQSEEPATADFSTAPEAANDTADAGSGSEAVANFSPSSGGLFQFDGGEAMMEALLVNASADTGALQTQDLALVREALAEGTNEAAVDAIVGHFTDAGTETTAATGGEMSNSVLLEALDAQLFFAGNGAPALDAIDDAAQLAAAAQA